MLRLVAICCACLSAIACETEKLTLNEPAGSSGSMPSMVDGRLVFGTEEALGTFLDEHIREEAQPIEAFLPRDFQSYRTAVRRAFDNLEVAVDQEELTETQLGAAIDTKFLHIDRNTNEVRPNVPDGPFSAVLNESGEIQVGDNVHRYTRELAQTLTRATDGTLTLLSEHPSSFVVLSSTEADDEELGSRAKSCTVQMNGSSRRRMKGEFQKNNFGVWGEFRFLTKRQKKRVGIWSRRSADYLQVNGQPLGFRCITQRWENRGAVGNNCRGCSITDAASGHLGDVYCGDDGDGQHRAIKGDSDVRCNTSR